VCWISNRNRGLKIVFDLGKKGFLWYIPWSVDPSTGFKVGVISGWIGNSFGA